jgi:pre-60S factor REI1
LKRKVAELPPVTAEDFKHKVLTQRAADEKAKERHSHYCETCKKAFGSDKSFESHLRSKKHKENNERGARRQLDDGIDETTESSTDEVIIQTLDNLRDLKIDVSLADGKSDKVIEVLQNLPKTQPETSKQGVGGERERNMKTKAEHTKLPLENTEQEEDGVSGDSDEGPQPLDVDECLFCPLVSESMEESVQHMSSAHGFFIPDLDYLVDLKGMVQYLCYKVGEERCCLYCQTSRVFYSIEAIQHHMVDKAHCKLFFEGDSALEFAEFYDYTKSYSSSAEQGEKIGEEDGDLPVPDSPLSVNQDLELVLPSGSKLSHRSMKQYYKQRLPTLEQRTATVVTRLMAQYRAIGWKDGLEGEGTRKRVMDEAWRHRMQQRRQLKLSVKANKQQHHFRPQVVF